MLNQRAIEILMELCNHTDEYLTGNYFSEKFHVSLRTIQGDMRDIKNELKNETCAEIISQASKGSCIVIKNYDEFSALMHSLYQQYAASSLNFSLSRIDKILIFLLHRHRTVSFFELEESFFVSSSTLRNDLKKIEEILKNFKLELLYSKNKVMVDGFEIDKRRCLLEQNLYLVHMKDEQGILYVDERQLAKIKDTLTDVFVQYKYYVSDEDFNNIILFTNVVLHRVKSGFTVQKEELDITEAKSGLEYEIANTALQKLGRSFLTTLSQWEAECFSIYLKGKGNHTDSDAISSEVNKFILESLESIKEIFGVDFTDNVNLRIALALHCMSLSARIKYDAQVKNNLLEYIRESFPLGYDLGTYLGHLLSKKYGKRVSEDEIGLLAIHFYSHLLEDKRRLKQKKILVISMLRKSMTVLLKQTLLKWFADDVSAIDFVNPIDMTEDILEKYSIFITTEKGKFYEMGLAMYINPFPGEKDYLNIRLNLDGFKDLDSITDLFNSQLFFVASAGEKDNILKSICDSGSKYCEQKNLYEQVIERENIGSTFFTKAIAVPHPMHAVSSDTFMVVYISKKPVVWDEDNNMVNLIILVHVGKNNPQAFQIWDYFSKIFSDKTLVKKLLKQPTYEYFIALVKEALEANVNYPSPKDNGG